MDPDDVVHVALLLETAEHLDVEILYAPFLLSAFVKSISLREEVMDTGDSWLSIQEWRERKQGGGVTAFSVPVGEARELAWKTALGEGDEISVRTHFLEYAFPVRSDQSGRFAKLEVAVVPRDVHLE